MSAVAIAEPEFVECPACEGRGEISTRIYRGVDSYEADWAPCGPCDGSGRVDAELVRTCEGCNEVYLIEIGGCPHVDLCGPCGPECKDCRRESAAEADLERFFELERIRTELTR